VTNGNPNGDPDAGNLPRVDPETMHGIVTDVAIKRKVRDYVALAKKARIFIQSEVSLNSLIANAYRDVGYQPASIELADEDVVEWFEANRPEGFDVDGSSLMYVGESAKRDDWTKALREAFSSDLDADLQKRLLAIPRQLDVAGKQMSKKDRGRYQRDARSRMCEDYYDIRIFGAVLQTGLNAGQVRGPMQLTFARSIDPVTTIDLAHTRKARTTAARMETGPTEFARKPFIPYGLYRLHGYFNPYFADNTKPSEEDLAWFWEALERLFWIDQSAARAEMACRGLYVFSHDSKLGNAPAHVLLGEVTVAANHNGNAPRCIADYIVTVPEQADLPAGVSLTRVVG
jgi:CRISPR-associated protein Csd2